MPYPVVVVRQPGRRPLHLQVRDTVEIGRQCDGLLIEDTQVSRRHLVLRLAGERVMVEDLGSTNGTLLDGTPISAPVVLRNGSVIRLGDTSVELVVDVDVAADVDRRTTLSGVAPRDSRVRASGEQTPGARETSIDALAREVRQTGPEITPDEFDGTITIVFSDIESSTERSSAMGDEAWMRILGRHNEMIRRHLREYRGREVKNQGDGFMLTFAGVRRALQCMSAVQRDMASFARAKPDEGVRIRVGVHTGEVMVDAGDIFGKHVNMAARVASAAAGEEILVSALVREIASARGDIKFGPGRLATFKGIEGEQLVYPVLWDDEPAPS